MKDNSELPFTCGCTACQGPSRAKQTATDGHGFKHDGWRRGLIMLLVFVCDVCIGKTVKKKKTQTNKESKEGNRKKKSL